MEFIVFLNEQWLLTSILLLLVVVLMVTESRKSGNSLSVHQLTRLVNTENALVLDLREGKEFSAGHITDATNIPFAKIKERIAELERHRGRHIILVDKMGQHTGAIGKQLAREGYQVSRLSGGMAEWSAQNLPVVKG